MNTRISGVIIAVAGAVAGALLPSAVQSYVAGQYLTSLGLALIVFLNAAIALLHILDRGKPLAAVQEGADASQPRTAAARRAADATISEPEAKRGKPVPPPVVAKTDAPAVTLVPNRP